jgi:PEGA domain
VAAEMRAFLLATAGVIVLGGSASARPGHHKSPPPVPVPAVAPALDPPAAAATGDTYAIIAIDISGDADPELKTAIAAAVARGLDRASAPHVAPDVVQQALRARPELVGCTSTTCLNKLGAIVGASRFITARIETAGAAYQVELIVLTPDGPIARKKAACEVCTMSEVVDLLSKTAAELVTAPGPQAVSITLATTPGGGEVSLSDGNKAGSLRRVGKAPASLSLSPGTYLVEVKLAGYSVLRTSITVADSSEPQSFKLAMTPIVEEGESTPFATWKWVAAGGAVAALIGGGVLLSQDGSPTCGTPPCYKVRDTMAPSLVLLGVGLGAGAGAGWMFWHDHGDVQARAAIAPAPGGATAAVTVEF